MSANLKTTLNQQVAFDEGDGEGIVFFGIYFRLVHRALEQGLSAMGLTWKDWFANEEFGVPLRHAEADYRKPLRPGDTYQVDILVDEVGDSSVRFAFEFKNEKSELLAVVKTTHVFVSRKERKKISIPDFIRQKL
jgi:YbgC/YbaW family acyl-CoA thioester hydrolase